jgi:hypothetical protein
MRACSGERRNGWEIEETDEAGGGMRSPTVRRTNVRETIWDEIS